MNRWIVTAINDAAFDSLWTVAMFGAVMPWWWAAPVLIGLSMSAQLRSSPSPRREAHVILAGAVVGTGLDSPDELQGITLMETYDTGIIDTNANGGFIINVAPDGTLYFLGSSEGFGDNFVGQTELQEVPGGDP